VSTNVSPAVPFTTVTSYLSWDHARLDRTLAGARDDLQHDRLADARHAFDEYARGLERHMRVEEELVFPVFEARTGMSGGPTSVMRDEHRSLRVALGMMRDGLDRGDVAGFQAGVRFLETVLPEHHAKEEHILYPTTDRLLSPDERGALTRRLQRE
jgi:iron-sulfur cluster repair protein YtfE (RIC family)